MKTKLLVLLVLFGAGLASQALAHEVKCKKGYVADDNHKCVKKG